MCIINCGRRPKAPPTYERQTVEDIFFVLATLGQHLYSLKVIDYSVLPQAEAVVRQAFSIGDNNAELAPHFDKAKPEDQSAVTCAMVFCSECWPMRIWQGFGCGLMNLMDWVNVQDCKEVCRNVDKSIAALKGKPREWRLLTKSPARIGWTIPVDGKIPKAERKAEVAFWKTTVGEWERDFIKSPPPHLDALTLSIPYAIAGGDVLYKTCGADFKAACKYQMDAGRLLYAWTVGKQAELLPGEALLLMQDHVTALAEWLYGLNGVTFELGTRAKETWIMVGGLTPLKESNASQVQKKSTISPVVTAQGPTPAAASQKVSPPAYSRTPASPVSPVAPGGTGRHNTVKHRPVPIPPAAVKGTAEAIHDFKPVRENELGFKLGDLIDILDDETEDDWWMARMDGKEGLIPRTYVQLIDCAKL